MVLGVLGLDVDFVRLPTSALEILVIVLLLAVIASAFVALLTTAATPLVDRRWPADEPLNPTEMLWGESGGYIRRNFPGLDVSIGKDINTQFTEVAVPPGENIVEQGEPSSHFYILKSGQMEVLQRNPDGSESIVRHIAEGDSFGEVGILRRTPRTATIRAVTDCVVLQLPAEEFIAGVAFSAAEGNELMTRVNEYLVADAKRAATVAQAPAMPTADMLTRAAPAQADMSSDLGGAGAGPFVPTHVVAGQGTMAWPKPDASLPPFATLPGGTQLRRIGEAGAWAHVVAQNGWEGWVDGRMLTPR
jgi:CRP-like cAMP-binding protein